MKTGYIMVEIMGSNPADQIRIKPLCSNCDGLEVWVKPEDILTRMNYIAEENLKNMHAEELRRDLGRKETGMSLEQDIRAEIENIKKLKMEVGNINNHLSILEGLCRGDMQKQVEEDYQKGINDGSLDVKQRVEGAYQSGLEDAWEAARKIATWPDRRLVNSDTFDLDPGESIFTKYSASEAIAKLKAFEYKQKEDDSIKVGDEVINNTTGTKGILLEPETEDLLATVIVPNLRWSTFNISHINLTKTGRHFDIEGILEAMHNVLE